MPDYWLEASLHPVGPASGQLDEVFPWFSFVPEQITKLQVALDASHAALLMLTLMTSP
jgi:hypothetical protein